MTRETQDLTSRSPVAVVTGGTEGLGLALVRQLAADGWRVVTDGRSPARHERAAFPDSVTALVGDLTSAGHRADLAAEVARLGRLDLLVHSASTLGPLPMGPLAELGGSDLTSIWDLNVLAAHELNRLLVPRLVDSGGLLVSISSDAAVEHYESWGGYGATKAALDHLTLTTATEAGIPGYAVDPGDMRTRMHADAFPGEDISDRPLPETVVPHLMALFRQRPPTGRYRAAALEPR